MKNFKFYGLLFIATATYIVFVAGSATQKEPMLTPSFNWSAKTTQAPGTAGITIALIQPSYIVNWRGTVPEPFRSYRSSLEADYLELLTGKGFIVRGPFTSRDEMVYSDKEACDFILTIDIDSHFGKVTGGWNQQILNCPNGTPMFKYKGVLSFYGKINMSAIEPISGEKIWTKSVDIPEGRTSEVTSDAVCGVGIELLDLISQQPSVANPFTSMLQGSYVEILDKCDRLIEPVEFLTLKQQIQKLKTK